MARFVALYIPLCLLFVQVFYCFYHVYKEKEEVFIKTDYVRLPILFASLTYITITALCLGVEGYYRRRCRTHRGFASSNDVYVFFAIEQLFILKPWAIMLVMMMVDINYVRAFIIQLYLQPKKEPFGIKKT